MEFSEHLFSWSEVHLVHFYIYLTLALAISCYLILKSRSKHKLELFFLSFFLLSGNYNHLLTISIPGFDLFEIQPKRFLLFLFLFFLFKKVILRKEKLHFTANGNIPWFELVLYLYFVLYIISLIVNIPVVGFSEFVVNISDVVIFLVIIISLRHMNKEEDYMIIGKSILIAASFSSVISIAQVFIDSYFLRIGDPRVAFGETLRANGIFTMEQYNSYFIIMAMMWAIVILKNKPLKVTLIILFSTGVLLTFHRMSWVILVCILVIYLTFLERVSIDRLLLTGLCSAALFLVVFIFYYNDIMNTSLVKERLSDSIEGRIGYYTMVMESLENKPLFGYGGRNNDVYYSYMLKITKNRERATGEEGGIHSGYFTNLFYSGIPVFLCFTFFVVLAVIYFGSLVRRDLFFAIPFTFAFIFLVGNLTNSLLFPKYIGTLYAIHLGIALGMKRIKDVSPTKNRAL